uniref:Uncharacterized protein n=1 Tax=Micrurus paraensis TaxID=1970185 RepID=A0A2D4KHZ3_9SAUR
MIDTLLLLHQERIVIKIDLGNGSLEWKPNSDFMFSTMVSLVSMEVLSHPGQDCLKGAFSKRQLDFLFYFFFENVLLSIQEAPSVLTFRTKELTFRTNSVLN